MTGQRQLKFVVAGSFLALVVHANELEYFGDASTGGM